MIKKIGILTSGGDAPGMNAAIRAVTRSAIYNGLEVFAIEKGFVGLINDMVTPMNKRSVSDIIQRGGTILKTARCPEFTTLEGQKKGAETLKKYGIEALVVIGGNGSFRGAQDLSNNFGINTIGIPGTIDNDLHYTDYTLGFDTAVNTVLNAINNLRDTMTSHDRVSIIEVMGRKCGDIALYAGISGGAEIILTPEMGLDIEDVCKRIKENLENGKSSDIIVLAEGVCSAEELKIMIDYRIGKNLASLRTTRLGHIQRGGTPTMQDRLLGAEFGVRAVELIMEGKTKRVVGIRNNKIIDEDIDEALAEKEVFNEKLYEDAKILSL
jgi:6-phosphofructokinase 1